MKLVYGIAPKDGNIDELTERKVRELATRIITRISKAMKLEDQENTPQRHPKDHQ